MSKRFTDSEKWKRPWFRQLSPVYKCLWFHITDTCDLVGLWYPDFELASFMIGEKLDPASSLKVFEKQVRVTHDGRWFITDFVSFQYGDLKANNNLHRSVIARLEALGEGLGRGTPAPPLTLVRGQGKGKGKGKGGEEGAGDEGAPPKQGKPLTPVQVCVEIWKRIEGVVPEDDELAAMPEEERAEIERKSKAWDKVYFSRHTRSANQLLSILGDPQHVEECMEAIVGQMRSKSLSYTIETVVKHADTWSREQAAENFKRMAESRR